MKKKTSRKLKIIKSKPQQSGWKFKLLFMLAIVLYVLDVAGIGFLKTDNFSQTYAASGKIVIKATPTPMPVLPQNPITGNLQGIMTDNGGNPVVNVKVQLTGNGIDVSMYTNSDGYYQILNINPGSYMLSVWTKRGMYPFSGILIQANATTVRSATLIPRH
jgi:hypothetical protein